jgi:hypothetical protein
VNDTDVIQYIKRTFTMWDSVYFNEKMTPQEAKQLRWALGKVLKTGKQLRCFMNDYNSRYNNRFGFSFRRLWLDFLCLFFRRHTYRACEKPYCLFCGRSKP